MISLRTVSNPTRAAATRLCNYPADSSDCDSTALNGDAVAPILYFEL
jgi:hypothetical protein